MRAEKGQSMNANKSSKKDALPALRCGALLGSFFFSRHERAYWKIVGFAAAKYLVEHERSRAEAEGLIMAARIIRAIDPSLPDPNLIENWKPDYDSMPPNHPTPDELTFQYRQRLQPLLENYTSRKASIVRAFLLRGTNTVRQPGLIAKLRRAWFSCRLSLAGFFLPNVKGEPRSPGVRTVNGAWLS